jgi:hypothetical protein
LVHYTFIDQNIMSRKDLFTEQLPLAGAEQYARTCVKATHRKAATVDVPFWW